MKLRTDDDIYRARLVYLGPPGYPLPFHLPYAEWGLFVALLAGFGFALWVITGTWMSAGFAVGLAMFMTSYIWRHVDPDRPARKVLLVFFTDWRRIKARTSDLPRLAGGHIRFSALPEDNR